MKKHFALLVAGFLFTGCTVASDEIALQTVAKDAKTSPEDEPQLQDSDAQQLDEKDVVDNQPIAVALNTKGKITLIRAPNKPRQLFASEKLYAGDSLTTDADGTVTLHFFNGKEEYRGRLKSDSTVVLSERGCIPKSAVQKVNIARPLSAENFKNIKDLARSGSHGGGAFRGPKSEVTPQAVAPQAVIPICSAVILTDRPTLSWAVQGKAEEYRVSLLSGNETIWKISTKDCLLAFPEKEKPLASGLIYRWRVYARASGTGDEILHVESWFLTATKMKATELAQLEPLVNSEDADDWLLAAMIYEANIVDDEALRCYERLAERSPNEVSFQLALGIYYERGGRLLDSKKARNRAEELGAVLTTK